MMKGFKHKWMRADKLAFKAEHKGNDIIFKIPKNLIEGKLPKSEFWTVRIVDDGFIIQPSRKVLG